VPFAKKRLDNLETDPKVSAHIFEDEYCRLMLDGVVNIYDQATARDPMIPTTNEYKRGYSIA
jgi:hypothetical protein